MLNNISRVRVIGVWFAAVVVMFALSVVGGAPMTTSAGVLWLAACLAPPAVMLLVWRSPALTVAEVLYAVNNPAKDGKS